jgi:hypothetical protein
MFKLYLKEIFAKVKTHRAISFREDSSLSALCADMRLVNKNKFQDFYFTQ